MRSRRFTPILFLIALAGGCIEDEYIPTQPPDHSEHVATTIDIEAPTTSFEMGEIVQLSAVVTCDHGVVLDEPVSWTSSDEAAVTVDAEGLLRAIVPGSAEVRAVAGEADASLAVDVTGVFVGPEGGEVASPDRALILSIPEDALATTIEFVCQRAPSTEEPGNPGYVRTTAFECEPEGLRFEHPAQLRIEYEPDHVPDGYSEVDLRIRHRARNADVWEETNQNRVLELEHAVEGEVESLSFFALISVPPAEVIQITGVPEPAEIEVGDIIILTAQVFDVHGRSHPEWHVSWSSNAPDVATVDAHGRLEALTEGTAMITASHGSVKREVEILVTDQPGHGGGGPPDGEHVGNNLSYPVIFTEGIGLTGLPVSEDPGVRPTAEEGIDVDALPFFYDGNRADYSGTYYLQQGDNTWQAMWVDGSLEGAQSATVYWGDNLTHHTWNTHSMIRVEHVLESATSAPLEGFNMTYLYGEGPDEMQGADGTIGPFVPTLYSVTPRLTIEKLDGEGGTPVYTAFDGAVHEKIGVDGPGGYGAEVNVAGKVIYGFNFMVRNFDVPAGMTKYGWWRITFSLDPQATVGGTTVTPNLSLDFLGVSEEEGTEAEEGEPLGYAPELDTAAQRTWLDIWIESASGGGGGGH